MDNRDTQSERCFLGEEVFFGIDAPHPDRAIPLSTFTFHFLKASEGFHEMETPVHGRRKLEMDQRPIVVELWSPYRSGSGVTAWPMRSAAFLKSNGTE